MDQRKLPRENKTFFELERQLRAFQKMVWRQGQIWAEGMEWAKHTGWVEREVGKNEAGDLGRGKIREALDGLPKIFNFILYVIEGFW